MFTKREGKGTMFVASLAIVCCLGSAISGCKEKDIEAQLPPGCRPGNVSELSAPASVPAAKPGPATVTPDSLRTMLLEGDTSILMSWNSVIQAKHQVDVARDNLLPGVNLSSLFSFALSPAFLISQVQYLLPFLVPSNWFDYFQSKDILGSEVQALQIEKLNEYASAYSVYLTILNDVELESILQKNVDDLSQIVKFMEINYHAGMGVTLGQLTRAQGDEQTGRAQLAAVVQIVNTERSAIRHLLGLAPDASITFTPTEVPVSNWENQDLPTASAHALSVAPEAIELQDLAKAAREAIWSKAFGFISGADLAAAPGAKGTGSTSSAFTNLGGIGVNVSLGFGMWPAFELSRDSEKLIELRQRELEFETTDNLEVTFSSIRSAKEQYTERSQAETDYTKTYEEALLNYKVGQAQILDVLTARQSLWQASQGALAAKTQLALGRITLLRVMLEGEFGKIEGCNAQFPANLNLN